MNSAALPLSAAMETFHFLPNNFKIRKPLHHKMLDTINFAVSIVQHSINFITTLDLLKNMYGQNMHVWVGVGRLGLGCIKFDWVKMGRVGSWVGLCWVRMGQIGLSREFVWIGLDWVVFN